ncbi:uncharacterized protein METZ01_LOCUS414222, partial [marine metagenome]
ASAPTLYYWCHHHASMGGTANTPAEASTTSMRYKIETKNQSVSTGYQDSSSGNHTITKYNSASLTTTAKYGSHSLSLTGGYFGAPSSSDWTWGTGNFTIEAWMYIVGAASTKIVMGNSTTSSVSTNWRIYSTSSGMAFGSSQALIYTGTTALPTGAWFHFAVSRSGSSNYMYINGTADATGTVSNSNNFSSTQPFWMGKAVDFGQLATNFYLDEVRLSNTARYTSNFNVSNAPHNAAYANDGNTKLLIHGDETGKITRVHGTSLAWS